MNRKEIMRKQVFSFEDLINIMALLRSDEGCPWDKAQTHDSIRKNFIEEVYEVVEAIDDKNDEHMCEELGDVLLQVAFHSQMARDRGAFGIDDVTTGICKKLIYRHPHIFTDEEEDRNESYDSISDKWEELKRSEKGIESLSDALQGVCRTLPALMYAEKLIKKTKDFKEDVDLPDSRDVLSDDEREIAEKLFDLCRAASDMHIDAEEVLYKLCREYVGRRREETNESR